MLWPEAVLVPTSATGTQHGGTIAAILIERSSKAKAAAGENGARLALGRPSCQPGGRVDSQKHHP